MKPKVLLIDDDPGICFGFTKYLSRTGYDVTDVSNLAEGKDALSVERFDVVLLDLNLPDGSGLHWIEEVRSRQPDIALVVITGEADVPTAVEAMRKGADNFLTKPVNMTELDIYLKKSLEVGTLRRSNAINQRLSRKSAPFFGRSGPAKSVMELALLAAGNESVVLLLGETGAGKGILGRWIHDHSSRRDAPFVEINCSNLKGDLLASELFGHVRGAFTSAVQDRPGLIEMADRGTLFLDEIGDMDFAVQATLLKVLEERQYRRVGEAKMRKSNFRLICATNKNLSQEVGAGKFRQDLYYRIYVFPVTAPPLRELTQDIPGFVFYFIRILNSYQTEVSEGAMELLTTYPWPGNVRELKNVIERALLLSRGNTLTAEHFPGLQDYMRTNVAENAFFGSRGHDTDQIRRAMESCGGNSVKAAAMLGISRATLYRRLKNEIESAR